MDKVQGVIFLIILENCPPPCFYLLGLLPELWLDNKINTTRNMYRLFYIYIVRHVNILIYHSQLSLSHLITEPCFFASKIEMFCQFFALISGGLVASALTRVIGETRNRHTANFCKPTFYWFFRNKKYFFLNNCSVKFSIKVIRFFVKRKKMIILNIRKFDV